MRYLKSALGVVSALLFVMLAACTSASLPEYRQSLFDGINQTNAKTLLLYATVSSGSSPGQFAALKPRYDEVIAAFDAIRIQVNARGWPSRSLLGSGILNGGSDDEADSSSATEDALVKIGENLTELRDTHRSIGLAKTIVALSKSEYETMIRVVLTVENALRR